jgi:hypothetical protein
MVTDPVPAITESIATSAVGPKRIRVDGMGESEEHGVEDQIAAAKYLPPAAVRRRVGKGIKFTKASAGGTVYEHE